MNKIDAHIHFGGDTPEAQALLQEFDLKLLNICLVAVAGKPWRDQVEAYRRLAQEHPDRFAWCTTFDLPDFDDPQYVSKAIQGLEQDFADGAVACKVWKNLGMEVLTPSGEFFMVDDPLLAPIFEYIALQNKALLMHIAEPLACWLPLNPADPHHGYYSQNPQWHMYGKSGMRSHQELIESRDNVAARHPNLRVIGAHLGSLEYDVAEVARRFDLYPNFAVDISARLADLAFQESAIVRQFFLDYQDRILYGTDRVTPLSIAAQPEERQAQILQYYRRDTLEHFRYLETAETFELRGREVRGINLPPDVLEKVYYTNALRWYPGID
jgi:predicted TIM-barrel fold metal-dependent hydrolase